MSKHNKEAFPENLKDELEAYPLRLNVSALPDRVFFKMTRTLTISVVLLSALLIIFATLLNYQITHLDVSIKKGSTWQIFSIDPLNKQLKVNESASILVDPMLLVTEARLREYLIARNSTVWAIDTMTYNLGNAGVVAQLSEPQVFNDFQQKARTILEETRGKSLIRDTHIFDLNVIHSNLWQAIIETYDLPITDDLVSECNCTDNSKKCINCKISKAVKRERTKIFMRTSFKRPKSLLNPLGISVDSYTPLIMPIHEKEPYWDLAPDLRPEI